ncbi:MAG: hypothetical protein ACOCRU_00730 [bacterium]
MFTFNNLIEGDIHVPPLEKTKNTNKVHFASKYFSSAGKRLH